MTARRTVRGLLAALAGLLVATLLAIAVTLALLSPRPGEWAVPLRIGPWRTDVSVPAALRLATAAPFARWLDGRRLATRWGPVQLRWQQADRSLHVQCAPCSLPAPALGYAPLQLPRLQLSVFRDFETVQGLVRADTGMDGGPALQAWFTGRLQPGGLALHVRLPATPIADAYAVLAPQLPELRHARIAGQVALRVQLQLPEGTLRVVPQVEGFAVQGLGTEALAHAASSCGAPSRLRQRDWLARAVLAAEDQRFFEHPGYDLQELQAALQANQSGGQIRRGGSTLTQQLAKRLATGDERSATRKLRELLYAVEMEQTLGKARILQLYLDNAPWGAGLCGAEAAARGYFGRSARQLEPAQAVWLAAMLHSPDAEARAWQRSGHIALERAQWVAGHLRGGTRERDRRAIAPALRALAPPPGEPPPMAPQL